jgi:chemosensory pili system protein ChpA (sensor histidine kinase/response regulator)
VRAKALEQQLLAGDEPLCDQAVMHLIMQAGLSTAEAVTQISGRGFGMDVVATELQHLGASLQIDSQRGQGTQFYIRLPLKHSLRSAALASAMDTTATPL